MPVIGIEPNRPDGAVIKIEVDTLPSAPTPGFSAHADVHESAASRIGRARSDVFAEGLSLARACAARVGDMLGDLAKESRPEEFTLQLAIKLDSDVGAVIAKSSEGAQLQVTIKWSLPASSEAARGNGGRL